MIGGIIIALFYGLMAMIGAMAGVAFVLGLRGPQ